jgi:uncharacterized protein (DUF934 family)
MQFVPPQDPSWHRFSAEDGPQAHPTPADHSLLTLEQWHAVRSHWPADFSVGLELPNTLDVESLKDDLPRLSLVVLQFPKWTDGRAYSQAHVLRARLRFAGQLRASGEVLVDMLPLLARTGFDAVQLRADQNEASARRALALVTDHYQGDVVQTRPLFARLAA